jgi:hypothetical protein
MKVISVQGSRGSTAELPALKYCENRYSLTRHFPLVWVNNANHAQLQVITLRFNEAAPFRRLLQNKIIVDRGSYYTGKIWIATHF